MGFCSKCQDISGPLNNNVTYVDEYRGCLDPSQESSWEANVGGCKLTTRNYTYTFPELDGLSFAEPFFESSFDITGSQQVPSFYVIPLELSNSSAWNDKIWISFVRLSTEFPGFGAVLAADVCTLSYCAQKRNVSVSLNQLSSTILQTAYGTVIVLESNSEEFIYFPQLSFIGDDFNMTFPSSPTKLYSNGSQSNGDGLDEIIEPLLTWETSLTDLSSELDGSLGQPLINASTGTPVLPEGSMIVPGMYNAGETDFVTSNFIAAFNASSNISMTMDNIATALTNYVRDSSSITVVGQAGQVQIYVQVIWPWIILPAFLVVAGTGFLMLAMLETKRRGACIWKTSELSLLFHGLKDLDQELHALHPLSEMEHAASEIRVKMVKTSGGGWILHREKGNKFV